jgi:hypothetical protein
MKNGFLIFEDKHSPGFIKSAMVAGGIVGGLISMLTGLILSTLSYFNRTNYQGVEMILFIASITFLVVGAHTLDLIEEDRANRKSAIYENKNSTPDERETYKIARP